MNLFLKTVPVAPWEKNEKRPQQRLNEKQVTTAERGQLKKKTECDRKAYTLDEVILNLYLTADRQK